MSGLSLAIGALAVTATLAMGCAGIGVAASRSIRAASAADASALAAADAASGAVVGVPCERAAEIAARHGAALEDCTVEGLIATVEVSAPVGVFTARARARAGPPP